jgi:ankyrin repeat protein
LLLDKGADVEMKEEAGGTPLIRAIVNGSEAIIKLLLAKGAKVDYLYSGKVSEPDRS